MYINVYILYVIYIVYNVYILYIVYNSLLNFIDKIRFLVQRLFAYLSTCLREIISLFMIYPLLW